jgi:polymerase delta-interacting protein 2
MYIPRDVLHPWRERNHSWLELSQVHRETTQGVRVTVMPFFMGHKEQQHGQGARAFYWRYNVRIESLEEVRVQLKERQWRVYSEAGTLETVNGKGVIGQVT